MSRVGVSMATVDSSPKNVVVLHQFPPTANVVNASPPCLKLETYLRMARIPFEKDLRLKMSRKGKMPWIEYKGIQVADSNFCIRFLNEEYDVDLSQHLNAEQKAIAHCLQTMIEENTYWSAVYYRWLSKEHAHITKKNSFKRFPAPLRPIIFRNLQGRAKRYLDGHGMGRHTPEEIYAIAERDLRAVSDVLGSNDFLFGTSPCVTDASVFALVANFAWDLTESPQGKLIRTELTNLERHANRMKERFFPDWEEIIKDKQLKETE